ncbi:hypothetical protein ASPZODRAFT_13448 [Penicilliopsis zonata CBS 506.65]|uniref:HNH nuclease domain-containing protein n=1 Tax=Penicilliopsis zonata CBS 506.65 TaxID=1073090 RepID=A0A1L9STC3_9EURO|nr:hypothetical protein ASPZODRAFT_13448 [Penicilliopsis zonata CBS 506.65]OJJ50364.1 hypothetical protein ASPZODRAFT_13448 [Penicilliopsis zonata CBS 506.65]
MTGKACWACGLKYAQVAHVVAKEDSTIELLDERGLMNFHLRSKMNAVALCRNCHYKFDEASDPGLVFFPADLDYFIEFELQDRARRQRLRDKGRSPRRRAPTDKDYRQHQVEHGQITADADGGLYRIIYLETGISGTQAAITKSWNGAPMATLRRGIACLGTPRIEAVPIELTDKLQILRDLYFRNDELGLERKYGLQRPAQGGGTGDDDDNDDDDDEEKNDDDDDVNDDECDFDDGGEPTEEGDDDEEEERYEEVGGPSKKRSPRKQGRGLGRGGKKISRRARSDSGFCWEFGPNSTSQSAMEGYVPALRGPG